MPINKPFTTPSRCDGDHHVVAATNFTIDGSRMTIAISVQSYKSAADRTAGATPMRTKNYVAPSSIFTAAQLNVLRNVIQNHLIANEADFQGGTVV